MESAAQPQPPFVFDTTAPTPPTTPSTTTSPTTSSAPVTASHPPIFSTRKYSFVPLGAALQNTAVGAAGLLGADAAMLSGARRRLSNVSDAVQRKLSHTIGWRQPAVPAGEILRQARCLCGQYVRGRLRRAGVHTKKMGLHRMRSFVGGETASVVRDVYPALNCVSVWRFNSTA